MMFKFNFDNSNGNEDVTDIKTQENDCWYKSKEIEISNDVEKIIEKIPRDQILKVDYDVELTFSCLSPNEVINLLKEKSDNQDFLDALEADKQHSDLLPGKYEGGLKTWECTKDLVVYFMKNVVGDDKDKLKDKSVLDLGCGSGILGIMALLLGGSVTFQDYNQEVLESMTISNIFLNCGDLVKDKVKLYSGDWSSFLEIYKEQNSNKKFDYILTSETIYNRSNYNKLISIFKELLKSDGTAFVAAKTHYFGVGGNLKEFESLLIDGGLKSKMCWEIKEGVSRGILEVTLQRSEKKCDSVVPT